MFMNPRLEGADAPYYTTRLVLLLHDVQMLLLLYVQMQPPALRLDRGQPRPNRVVQSQLLQASWSASRRICGLSSKRRKHVHPELLFGFFLEQLLVVAGSEERGIEFG